MKGLILLAGLLASGAVAQPARIIGAPAGLGNWPAVAEARSDAPGYTVYRPASPPKAKLPLVLWGNGGCRNNGSSVSHFLREIASHGYIVVANGAPGEERPPLTALPTMPPPESPAPPPPATADETSVTQLLGAIDWAAQTYPQRVDTSRIAVMGHSCGGLQAIAAGADPRIDTVVAFNSGVYNQPGSGRSRIWVTKDDLKKLHTPIAYILGGPTDIAYPNGTDDFARIDHVPVFLGNMDTGHGGTFALTNGGAYGRIAVAWLDWQLKGDDKAGRMFVGPACGMCADRAWTIARKQFPEKP
jgi:dienelactone hydrolase